MYVKEPYEYLELDDGDDRVEGLCVRIRGKVNKPKILVRIYYRAPNQDKETDKIFHKHLGEVS